MNDTGFSAGAVVVTDQMVRDQLCAAFEGGSNYWLRKCIVHLPDGVDFPDLAEARISAPLVVGGFVTLVDGVDGRAHVLDRAAIERGVKAMQFDCPRQFGIMMAESGDADTADIFLQCCLFGSVIYG